jgi:glycerophosphoryl diester phosphodiesterase
VLRSDAAVAAAFRRAWALRGPYLATHLLAVLASAAVLAPLVSVTARLAALTTGAPAVADTDIARLALSPAGLIGLLALASVLIAVNTVEIAVMMSLDAGRRGGRTVSALGAFLRILPRLPAILRLALRVVVRLVLRALPFLLAGLVVARLLLGGADINYYLSERPPAFLWAVGIGVVLGLGLAVVIIGRLVAWCLALPAVVLGETGPRDALSVSEMRTRAARAGLLRRFVLWGLASVLLVVAVNAVAGMAARLVAPGPASDAAGLGRVATHVLLSLALLSGVSTVIGTAVAGSLASLLVGIWREGDGPVAVAGAVAPPRKAMPVALVLVGAALVSAGLGAVTLVSALRAPGEVVVIAHRGASASRPENTLPAVEQAIAEGADWIEIDVQESADGAVMVVHDSDFMKLAGVPTRVWEASAEEIGEIDVGAWFGPDFAGTRVPTLAEVLAAAEGRARVLIELKHYGHAERLEERVAGIVEAAGMTGQIAVMSLDHPSAARMKALRPEWRVGLLAATALGDLARLEADFLAVSSRLASAGLIARARARGNDVYVWTVNDPVSMSRFISLGAAGLITDRPGLAREVIAARAAMSVPERLALLASDLFGVAPARGTGGRDASP